MGREDLIPGCAQSPPSLTESCSLSPLAMISASFYIFQGLPTRSLGLATGWDVKPVGLTQLAAQAL